MSTGQKRNSVFIAEYTSKLQISENRDVAGWTVLWCLFLHSEVPSL